MNLRFHIARLMATVALLMPVLSSCASKLVLTPAQVGHWEGNARIIVIWCQHTNLLVKLDIQADGSVTGTVGDARLKEGRFLKNRGWLGPQAEYRNRLHYHGQPGWRHRGGGRHHPRARDDAVQF